MAKSAEAIDTVSLSSTSEAVVQLLGRFMDAIFSAFNPFMALEPQADRQAVRSNYFEALDRSVKPVWMGIEEHELLEDYAGMVELVGSKTKAPDAVQFGLASNSKGEDVIVVTVISKSGAEKLEAPFTGEMISISDPTAEVSLKFEAVGIATVPSNFTDGASFLQKLQASVSAHRAHNPLDREFNRNVEQDQETRISQAGF